MKREFNIDDTLQNQLDALLVCTDDDKRKLIIENIEVLSSVRSSTRGRPDLLSIQQLAKAIGVSERRAREMAHSRQLRNVKNAVFNFKNIEGKNDDLRIDFNAVLRVYATEYQGLRR